MLLPRYSIRTVLLLAILVAVVALVAGQAVQGAAWAQAVTVAVGSLAVLWLVFAVFYGMVALFALVTNNRSALAATRSHYPERQRNSGMPGNIIQKRLPAKAKSVSRTSGLYLEVRDDGLGNGQFGYRRVLFDVQSPSPVTADTQITVRATVTNWRRSQSATTIEVDGELLAGQTKTTLELRFPQTFEWHFMWWQVWIDAVPDEQLSIEYEDMHQLSDTGMSRWRNNQMLILDARPPRPPNNSEDTVDGPQIVMRLDTTQREASVSDNWLDLTPYDFVYCEVSDLLSTARDTPERMAELRKWVHAGGVLWVHQQSEDWRDLHDIEPLFDWQPGEGAIEPAKPEGRQPPGKSGWSYANLRLLGASEEEDGLVADFGSDAQTTQTTQDSTPIYSEDMFVVRRHGWGMVAAFQENFPRTLRQLPRNNRRLANMYWQSQAWPVRHGLIPGSSNAEFSNWLIPGVGLAPVITFQVLITLFVIGIGPANYWLLKRAGKIHLLVLTVPATAAAITLCLLGYGLLSDGFSTRLRAQSITLLDQQTGDATSWSRLSYYAAFAPRNGLTFSDDAAVYTISPGSIEAYDARVHQSARDIQWTDNEQQLANGWLASRTPTQYLVVQPRTTNAGISLDKSGPAPSVTNRFDSAAQLLVVHDEEGVWWIANEVPAGEGVNLEGVKRSEAVAALREVLNDREPRFPEAYAAAENSAILYQQRRNMRRNNSRAGMDYSFVSTSQSLLQRQWKELLGHEGEALDIPAGSYVVVSDEALLPVSEDTYPVEEASVHIVIGKL
ncbi:Uncharacterized protein SCF082_LOCUS22215 [Durusdinium trenchii]|uniref:Uncharacterized protein n=1 Tax=Durusdinium trenchii TaxID=1381693 RepID=A0ABP0LHC7_9DINO